MWKEIQSLCEHPNLPGIMTSQHTTLRDDFMNAVPAGMLTGYTGPEKDTLQMNPRMAADYDDLGSGAGRGYGGVDDDEDEELEDLTIDEDVDEDDFDDEDFDDEDDDFDEDDIDDDVDDDMDDDSSLSGRW